MIVPNKGKVKWAVSWLAYVNSFASKVKIWISIFVDWPQYAAWLHGRLIFTAENVNMSCVRTTEHGKQVVEVETAVKKHVVPLAVRFIDSNRSKNCRNVQLGPCAITSMQILLLEMQVFSACARIWMNWPTRKFFCHVVLHCIEIELQHNLFTRQQEFTKQIYHDGC